MHKQSGKDRTVVPEMWTDKHTKTHTHTHTHRHVHHNTPLPYNYAHQKVPVTAVLISNNTRARVQWRKAG